MSHHRFATGLFGSHCFVLVAGCAGPNAASLASNPVATDLARASGLAGTWHGDFGWIGASFYEDETRITLRIEEDGTFTAIVTRNGGANNLAKATTWSGTVVTRGKPGHAAKHQRAVGLGDARPFRQRQPTVRGRERPMVKGQTSC